MAADIRPNLILLDIQLFGTLTARLQSQVLKSDPQLQSIPIIAVTSYAMVGDREKSLAAGAAGYIEKPINPETFVAEVERFLPPSAKERTP